MSESLYAAMRAYVDVAVELQVRKALETRSAPQVIEGPPGPKGDPGERGADSTVPGPKGDPGVPGDPGERGANGLATLEDVRAAAQEVFADFQVRTFADIYQGVYKPDQLYNRGLITTWGGSLWLSLSPTKAKPGETPDWRLIVKK